jgi:hypothetical protein
LKLIVVAFDNFDSWVVDIDAFAFLIAELISLEKRNIEFDVIPAKKYCFFGGRQRFVKLLD